MTEGHDPNDHDRYAVYRAAHHDIWWAKSQQWHVANWALVLIAAVVAVARTVHDANTLSACYGFAYVVLVIAVAVSAAWYLRRLHRDIVYNRLVYRKLEKDTGIARLRDELPRKDGLAPFHKRGLEFIYVMITAVAVAVGFAAYALVLNTWIAVIAAAFTFIVDFTMVHGAKRAA